MIWSKQQLSQILQIDLHKAKYSQFNNILTHSKYVSEGDVFIALKGTNNDGHNFISEAISKGAHLVLFSNEEKGKNFNNEICFQLSNLEENLIKLAKHKRRISKAKFIGITGSAGKTTTKELCAELLSKNFKVFKSMQSFNWKFYIWSCLASIPDDLEIAIFEFGMCTKGEILDSTKLFNLDVVAINNVFSAHIENFTSEEGIAHAKAEILYNLNSEYGTAVINFNTYEEIFSYYIKHLNISRLIVTGENPQAQVRFEDYSSFIENNELKASFTYNVNNKKYVITRQFIHKSIGENFRTVLGIILALNLNIEEYIEQFSQFKAKIGRGQVLSVKSNNQEGMLHLYCDYYNSNPIALQKSLISLGRMPQKYKISIIGDMLELGDKSMQSHIEIIEFVKLAKVQILILVGTEVQYIFDKAREMKEFKTFIFKNTKELIPMLDKLLPVESITLIKGSRKIGLNKILQNWHITHDI